MCLLFWSIAVCPYRITWHNDDDNDDISIDRQTHVSTLEKSHGQDHKCCLLQPYHHHHHFHHDHEDDDVVAIRLAFQIPFSGWYGMNMFMFATTVAGLLWERDASRIDGVHNVPLERKHDAPKLGACAKWLRSMQQATSVSALPNNHWKDIYWPKHRCIIGYTAQGATQFKGRIEAILCKGPTPDNWQYPTG